MLRKCLLHRHTRSHIHLYLLIRSSQFRKQLQRRIEFIEGNDHDAFHRIAKDDVALAREELGVSQFGMPTSPVPTNKQTLKTISYRMDSQALHRDRHINRPRLRFHTRAHRRRSERPNLNMPVNSNPSAISEEEKIPSLQGPKVRRTASPKNIQATPNLPSTPPGPSPAH